MKTQFVKKFSTFLNEGKKSEKTLEEIKEYLEETTEDTLIKLYNIKADKNIHLNDEEAYDYMFADKMEAVRATFYAGKDFTYTNKYVRLGGDGNLESTNDLSKWLDIDELADEIFTDYESFEDEM